MRCALCVLTGLIIPVFSFAVTGRADDEPARDSQPPASAEQLAFFTENVQPLLEENCYKCHGPGKSKGGLQLISRESVLKGGDSGPAVDLADPGASLILEALNYESYEMPPSGKLPREKINLVARWIEMGCPMTAPKPVAETSHHEPPQVNEETKNHWAFRPLELPPIPDVAGDAWVANPIDAFILARLKEARLSPNPPADRRTLCRRVYYDLLGLPPTPEEVDRFVNDDSADAYERLIEELLDSPHYGEHWARYWLDLVRYAESNSFERDNPKPFVWRYRDYVITALNNDKPYDQFVREQLAGDELDPRTKDGIIATGFYRLGLWDDEPADPELAFFDGLDDISKTTAQSFLGLTINCARCHDHKLDPISQKDYYSFLAFFRNVRHYGVRADETVYAASVRSIATPEEETAFAAENESWERRVAELRTELDRVESGIEPQLPGPERDDFKNDSVRLETIRKHVGELISQDEFDAYAQIRRRWSRLRSQPPESSAKALCVTENGADCPTTYVLIRGNPGAHGDEVIPGFPDVLSPPDPQIIAPADGQSTGRRRALAEWIVSPENPLTARVMVNRIWQWHFGRGIVRSPNNFGLQGDRPTHPQLLDWLASEFIARGWSLKEMHRLILMSNTYQMSSAAGARTKGQEASVAEASSLDPDPLTLDPQNDLFWRFDMRRLRAEEIRDSILAVNGSLNLESMFGPSIYPVIPPEVLAGQSRPGAGWGQSSPEDRRRRSIYIHIKRSLQVPLLAAFDAADTDTTCPMRYATTQPTQALSLLNSGFLNQQAGVFADYVRQQCPTRDGQVTLVLRRTTQHEPTQTEIDRGLELMDTLQSRHGLSEDESLRYFCLLALNLNEFVYLD
jgi:mono/diheme cytochrome c family protein